jgi:hypothetical protein
MAPARRSPDDAPLVPIEVDLGRVAVVGIVVWLVALVVALVLWRTDATDGIPAAVCATGAVLGAIGWDWARRHRTPPTPD